MPTIPVETLDQQLPTRTGLPRAVQEAPFIPNAPGNLGASQVVGNAVAGLGTSVLQANELAQQRAAIEERKRYADDVIAAKLGGQRTVLALQSRVDAEGQNPDYATLAARVEAAGKQLITEGGQGLSPRARQLYESQVLDNLMVFKQRAIDTESKRRDEMAAMASEGARAQAQQAMLDAQTPLEYEVAKTQLEETTRQMVDARLARGGAAAESVRKTIETVAIQKTEQVNRVNPRQMVIHLGALMANKPGLPGLPMPPRQELSRLYDDAQAELREVREMDSRGDSQAERDVRQAQSNLEVELTNDLYAIAHSERPTPEAIAGVTRKIMGAAKSQGPGLPGLISDEGQRRLLNLSGTLQGSLTKGKPLQDDPATEFRLTRGTLTPNPQYPYPTEAEIDEAVASGKLKPETGLRLVRERVKLLDEAHPSKIPEVVQAKTRVREGILQVIGFSDVTGSEAEPLVKGPKIQRFMEADALYDTMIEEAQAAVQTPQEKIAVARKLANPLKEQILNSYTLYFDTLAKEQMPRLTGGLEEIFKKQGLTAATQALNAQREQMGEMRYTLEMQNLLRREKMHWLGGADVAPSSEKEDPGFLTKTWFKLWQSNETGTPLVK